MSTSIFILKSQVIMVKKNDIEHYIFLIKSA